MTDPAQEFVARDGTDPDFSTALGVLDPPYQLEPGPARTVRRTWLDTFDWRLHRAGLVLEQTDAGGARTLALRAATAGRAAIVVAAPALSWPALAGALPSGALRDRLLAVSGIRALLPTAQSSSRQRQLRVLNGDGKTVAKLLIDVPRDAAAPRLSVTAVRGYQGQADRIARLLAPLPGIEPASTSAYEQALRGDGRVAGERPGTADVAMTADLPATTAIGSALLAMAATVETNVAGIVGDIDTEFLHDFRVAVRRARSVLKLTGDIFPAELPTRLGPELKWLGDMTSPTRDLDVYLLGVPAMAGELRSSEPADLDPFQAFLAQRRRAEHRRLMRTLRSARFDSLLRLWQSVPVLREQDGPRTAELAAQRVSRAYRRVVKLGSAITAGSPAQDLHTLRKRCKELRYLLEIFQPLHDRSAHRRALQVLKSLQDCLGRFQDSEVQAKAIRSFAGQMMAAGTAPPQTLLAMGELAAALQADQERARAEFAGEFASFMRPKNRLLLRRLAGATP